MILSVLAVPAYADKFEPQPIRAVVYNSGYMPYSDDTSGLTAQQEEAIIYALQDALDTRAESIDLSSANITISPESTNAIYNLIVNYINDTPEVFYAETSTVIGNDGYYWGGEWDYDPYTGALHSVKDGLTFTHTEEETAERMAAIEARAAKIMNELSYYGAYTEFDIALWLHDYLATNMEYDLELEKHCLDDALVDGVAVCSGYAAAYKYLLNMAGVECENAYNNSEQHEWSIVTINGNNYHVDVTYDDPTPDRAGYVSHDLFLLTDDEIKTHKDHSTWMTTGDETVVCDDNTYSNAIWHTSDIYTPIAFIGNDRYFVTASTTDLNIKINKCGKDMTSPEEFFKITDYWHPQNNPNSFYRSYFGGLGAFDNYLFYNTQSGLKRVDTTSNTPTAEYFAVLPDTVEWLGGSYVSGGKMYFANAVFRTTTNGTFISTDNANIMSVDVVPKYTVSFNTNGGSAIEDITVTSRDTITIPECTRDGYSFAGWYIDDGLTEKWDNSPISANMTLYAAWTVPANTVTYIVNGENLGTFEPLSDGTAPKKSYCEFGKIIEGWYTDEALTQKWDMNSQVEGNITLYGNVSAVHWYSRLLGAGGSSSDDNKLHRGVTTYLASKNNLGKRIADADIQYFICVYNKNEKLKYANTNTTGSFNIEIDYDKDKDGVLTYKEFAWDSNQAPYIEPYSGTLYIPQDEVTFPASHYASDHKGYNENHSALTDNVFYVYADEDFSKVNQYRLSDDVAWVVNDERLYDINAADFERYVNYNQNGKITLIDYDQDGYYDEVYIKYYGDIIIDVDSVIVGKNSQTVK